MATTTKWTNEYGEVIRVQNDFMGTTGSEERKDCDACCHQSNINDKEITFPRR
jgi:hypothetical protein